MMDKNPASLFHYGASVARKTGLSRLFHRSPLLDSPILVISIPKAGTNLLQNIVTAIPGTYFVGGTSLLLVAETVEDRLTCLQQSMTDPCPGCVYRGHIPYAPEIEHWLVEQGFRILFIFRDPRDYTVSIVHYVMQRPEHRLYPIFAQLGNHEDRLLGVIEGVQEGRHRFKSDGVSYPSVNHMYNAFSGWLHSESVFALRFEDLVGEKRHRSSHAVPTISAMLDFLQVPHDQQFVEHLLDKGMDPRKSGRNFRKGRSGSWREEFNEHHIERFHALSDDLLRDLGYTW